MKKLILGIIITLNIGLLNAQTVTISGSFTANDKAYDGTTDATIDTDNLSLDGVTDGDEVNLSDVVLAFANTGPGDDIVVSISSATLTGSDAGAYTLDLTGAPTSTASIEKASLILAGDFTADDKTYDGNTDADISVTTTITIDSGIIGSEDVSIDNVIAEFQNKNVNTNITVDLMSTTLTGTDAANYEIKTTPTATADISAKELTINGTLTADDKEYDCTNDATIDDSGLSLNGLISGDVVTLNAVGKFSNATIDTDKTVDLNSSSLTGTDKDNYTLSFSGAPTTQADITTRTITLSGSFSVNDKNYDGDNEFPFTLNEVIFSGKQCDEDVDVNYVAAAPDADFGSGKTISLTNSTLTGTDAGNYTLSFSGAPTTTADINKKTVTIFGTFTADNKAYDGNADATIASNSLTLIGVVGSEDVNLTNLEIDFESASVGNGKTVNITSADLSGADISNYTLSLSGAPTTTADITEKVLTISGSFTANDKIYDALTDATFASNTLTLSGIVGGDVVSFDNITIVFADKLIGTDKTVSITSASITGADAASYSLSLTGAPTTQADITARELSIGGSFTANDKTYDGTTDATINANSLSLTNIAGSDDVSLTDIIIEFEQAEIGTGLAVDITSADITGTDKDNYTLSLASPPTTTADITAKTLTITGTFTADNKTYDGNTSATIDNSSLALDGVEGSDDVSLSAVGNFDNKNVGNGKVVNLLSSTLSGADIGNYTLSFTGVPTTTANITEKEVTIAGSFTANNKTYDGTTDASFNSNTLSLSGVEASDDLSLNPVLNFVDKNVGIGKTVNLLSSTISGTDAANYTLSFTSAPTTSADITSKELTIDGTFSVDDKTYDGTTDASIQAGHTLSLNGVVLPDDVSLTIVATFDNANIGTDKTVNLNASSLSGADISNYTLNTSSPTTLADITPISLTIGGSFTANNKIYDGNTDASFNTNNLTLNGVLGVEDVNLTNLEIDFSTPTVGSGKIVNITSADLSGADISNYELSLVSSPTTTADITEKELTISGSFTASDKIYNALTNATFASNNLTLSGIIGGDVVDFDIITIEFANKLIGTNKPVSITSATITGTNAANYSLSLTGAPASQADITARELSIGGSFSANDKIYDGTTDATINTNSLNLTNIAGSDDVSLTDIVIEFEQAEIGTNLAVDIISANLNGTDKDNYTLSLTSAPATTADITAKTLTITGSFTADNKVYDATTSATIDDSSLALDGIESGDDVSLSAVGNFENKNVGNGKDVDLLSSTLSGTNAGNYLLSFTGVPTTSANITEKEISITGTFSVNNRAYNGNTTALISSNGLSLSGVINPDDVTLEAHANFNTKDVGTGKTVDLLSSTLSGSDATNYSITGFQTTTADITQKELTISGSFSVNDKAYDANTDATIIGGHTLNLQGVVGVEDVNLELVANFINANVGNGKQVNLNSSYLTGTDIANYTLNASSPTTTANITEKELTIGGSFTVLNKTYNANTDATINDNSLSLNGVETGDDVSLNAVANFDTKNVGTSKPISLTSSTLSGADMDNYSLSFTSVPSASANITAKDITIDGSFTALSKVFDNTTSATLDDNSLTLTNVEAPDASNVILNPVLNFEDKNIGTDKVVNLLSSTISGSEASNYNLSFTSAPTTLADITAQELTIDGSFTAQNKTYDRTTTAQINDDNLTLDGVIGGHAVTLSNIELDFIQANVGNNINVNITNATLDGADAANYTLSLTGAPTDQADIIAKDITISGSFEADNKTYDGNTDATINSNSLSLNGVINPDDVTLSAVANFDTEHIGTDKTVSLTNSTITGSDAANYNLTFTTCPTAEADILAKELIISGSFTPADKEYDGNTIATFSDNSLTLTGIIGSEDVSLNTITIEFATANVGNSISVNITAADLSGSDHDNYTVTTSGSPVSSANITAKELTISGTFNAEDKIYDGNTDATITPGHSLSLSGIVLSDDVSLTPSAHFIDKNVGNNKTVNLLNSYLSGTESGNYTLDASSPTTTADISHKELTISGTFTAADKAYDGNTNATIVLNNLSLAGVVNTEDVALNPVLNFEDAQVGTNKVVNLLSSTLTGTEKDNYTLNTATANTTTADITSRLVTITGTFNADNKIYDGNTSAVIQGGHTLSLDNISGSDDVSLTPIANFTNKNVGNGKTVNLLNSTLSGADASNYAIDFTAAPTSTADITAKALTIGGSFTADDKVYDKTSPADINTNSLTLTGIINPDVVTLTANADFVSVDVGTGINVTLNNSIIAGADASNYTLSFSGAPTTSASITPKSITISGSFTANDKTYDGNTNAIIATNSLNLDGIETGDVVALNAIAKFDTPEIGNNKTVDITNSTISGSSSGNYTLDVTGAPITFANIIAQEITLSGTFTVNDKIYDGNNVATVNVNSIVLNGIAGSDDVSLNLITLFNNELVGTNKPVNLNTSTLTGADASNYTLSFASAPTTTADITEKELTITGSFTAEDKDYDGTTSAIIDENNLILSGIVSGDVVNLIGLVVEFDQSDVGTGIDVTITNASIVGDDKDNYALSLTPAPTTTADIFNKTLIIAADDKTKTYGETDPTNTVTYNGFISGEDENDLSGTLNFTRQVGETIGSYTITPSGLSSTNYNIQYLDGVLTIQSKELTINGSFTAFDKNYDGTTTATINENNLTLETIETGDDVTILNNSIVLDFIDANIGNNKAINITSASLTGSEAMNYTLSLLGAPQTTANITDGSAAPVTLKSIGDFINNGTFVAGTRKVSFNASIQQEIKTNASPFYNIEFNNTSNLNDAITLIDNLIIQNNANLTSGVITTDGNAIVFQDGATTNAGGPNAFIDGQITKSGTTPFVFPTGDVRERDLGSGNTTYKIWAPFAATPSENTVIQVEYIFDNDGLPTWWYHDWTHEYPLKHVSDREYWQVQSGVDLTNVSLYWEDSEGDCIHTLCADGTVSEDVVTVAYWDNIWKDAGGDVNGDNTSGYITSGLIPFSGFKGETQIGFGSKDPNTPLPIELLYFRAECEKDIVRLEWATNSETNNDYFIIEKSTKGTDWKQILTVEGAGNSNQQISYTDIDDSPETGANYYRLIQVDFDGTQHIIKIVSATCNDETNDPTVEIYPNPFDNEMHIVGFYWEDQSDLLVRLVDMNGKLVQNWEVNNIEAEFHLSLNMPNIVPGVYILELQNNKRVKQFKVQKK